MLQLSRECAAAENSLARSIMLLLFPAQSTAQFEFCNGFICRGCYGPPLPRIRICMHACIQQSAGSWPGSGSSGKCICTSSKLDRRQLDYIHNLLNSHCGYVGASPTFCAIHQPKPDHRSHSSHLEQFGISQQIARGIDAPPFIYETFNTPSLQATTTFPTHSEELHQEAYSRLRPRRGRPLWQLQDVLKKNTCSRYVTAIPLFS